MTLYQSWRDVPADTWRWRNFSPRELACKGTGSLLVDPVALDRLQALRDTLESPLLITSAYRSPEHNRRVGGAKGSLHMQGCAFDVRMDNQDPHGFEIAARAAGFRGIGYYPKQGFMHIDMGPERSWGDPFPRSATGLPAEAAGREAVTQSTTVQASGLQIATGIGAAASGFAALSGPAQVASVIIGGMIVLSAMWILKERIKAWRGGWR